MYVVHPRIMNQISYHATLKKHLFSSSVVLARQSKAEITRTQAGHRCKVFMIITNRKQLNTQEGRFSTLSCGENSSSNPEVET